MKTKPTALFLAAALAGLTVTLTPLAAPVHAQATASRSYDLAGFRAVRLAGSDNVRVTRGDRFAVVATGDPAALAALSIEVRDGTLVVARRPGRYSDRGATVAVTMPAIDAAVLAGSGDLRVAQADGPAFAGRLEGSGALVIDRLTTREARLDLRGSGDVVLDAVEAGSLALTLAGSGDIRAAGRVETAALALGGSGDIDAARLTAADLSVQLSGSGDVTAVATARASVAAHGSGEVVVTGGGRCTVSKSRSANVTCG